MPRFRKLMLIKCPKFFTGECDHTCPHFSHFLLENCNEDCPSCPVAVRNRCPCVDRAQVEAYWQQAVDEHTLLPARMVVPSSLVAEVAPPPALVQAIRREGLDAQGLYGYCKANRIGYALVNYAEIPRLAAGYYNYRFSPEESAILNGFFRDYCHSIGERPPVVLYQLN